MLFSFHIFSLASLVSSSAQFCTHVNLCNPYRSIPAPFSPKPLGLDSLDLSKEGFTDTFKRVSEFRMEAPGTVIQFSPTQHSHLVAYLAALHAGCITHDRTVATFLPPLSHEKLLTWWKERIAEVVNGTRVIHILVKNASVRPSGADLVGVVMLSMPFSETGKARGIVEKLLVHQGHRGKGAARVLLAAVEADALQRGRTLLTLDTETGSNAEHVYKKFGWIEVGKIPKYEVNPDGELKDETFFYKQL